MGHSHNPKPTRSQNNHKKLGIGNNMPDSVISSGKQNLCWSFYECLGEKDANHYSEGIEKVIEITRNV